MNGTILDPIQLNGTLSGIATLSGTVSEKKESDPIVDSNGNILVDSNDNTMVDYHTGKPMEGSLSDVGNLSAALSSDENITITLSSTEGIQAEITIPTSTGGSPYSGEYEVTPSTEVQVLYTDGKSMRDNVTINPIPSNYGRITWNGSFLTVS